MEIHHIRAFVAVANEGSFSRAAETIYKTQPSVSMSLKALESELGTELVDRSSRTIQLTEAGAAFLDLVGPLLHDWEEVPAHLVERLTGEPHGRLAIGAGEAVVLYLLPDLVQSFTEKYPEVELVVHHQHATETTRMLRSGELDVAIRSSIAPPTGLAFEHLFTVERVIIAHKEALLPRRLSVQTLSEWPFVVPWPQSRSRRVLENAMALEGFKLRIALEAGPWEALKRYVAVGQGLALIPDLAVEESDLDDLIVRPMGHLFGRDKYGLVTRRGRLPSRAAAAFIAELRRAVGSGNDNNNGNGHPTDL